MRLSSSASLRFQLLDADSCSNTRLVCCVSIARDALQQHMGSKQIWVSTLPMMAMLRDSPLLNPGVVAAAGSLLGEHAVGKQSMHIVTCCYTSSSKMFN